MTDDEIRQVLAEHDGTTGYARMVCPRCERIHPCQTYTLAAVALEARRNVALHG